jgi:hypothetical protein
MMRDAVVASLAALTACAGGGGVRVARCNAVATSGGIRMDARFTNTGDKPIAHVAVSADFYRNYTFSRAHGVADFSPVLDPGKERDATFDLEVPPHTGGPVMRCTADGVIYGDGTTWAGGS